MQSAEMNKPQMKNKKGIAIEGVTDILMWAAFLVVAAVVIWLLIKKFSA